MKTKTIRTKNYYFHAAVIIAISVISFMFTSGAVTEDAEMSWTTTVAGNITMVTGDAFGNTYIISRGSSGAILGRYDNLGNNVWTHQLQVDGLNNPECITTDNEGYCYIGGQTNGAVTLVGSDNQTITGTHAFIAKYSSNGVPAWIRLIGSERSDIANRMVISEDGYCYVTGDTSGDMDGQGPSSGTDPFIAKVSTSGELIWVNQLRESSASSGLGVGSDNAGNVYIAGQPAYIATYDSAGTLIQFNRLAGNFPSLMDIAVDDLGNAYLCGWDGGYTGYIVKCSSQGIRLWERTYRLNGWSCPKSIAAFTDGSNNVVSGGCQGGPSGGTSCEAFSRCYDPDGNLVSIYTSAPNICGQHVGIDSIGGYYTISDNQVIKVESPVYATAPLRIEAESASIESGVVKVAEAGYSGSGYVQFDTDVEGHIKWNLNIPRPGTKTLSLRFKNIAANAIPIVLKVNEFNTNPDLVLTSTVDVDGWALFNTEVYLGAGGNTVTIDGPALDGQSLCLDRIEVIDIEDSLTLGKSIVCSDQTQVNLALAAFDGKLASSWIFTKCPQWIEIDLGQEYPVNQTKLFGQCSHACQFEIEVKSSVDDLYRKVVDGLNNTVALNPTNPLINTFDSTQARYIRLSITGNTDSKEVNIYEFGVFIRPQRPLISIAAEGYRTIQSAVNKADNGSVIEIQPGLYIGDGNSNIRWDNKDLILTSVDPEDPVIVENTIIKGSTETPVLSLSNVSQESMLMGFTVIGGLSGLHCQEASPQIKFCRVIENASHGIEMQAKCDPVIRNMLICGNGGAGILMIPQIGTRRPLYNEPQIINCTIAGNIFEGADGGRFSMRNCIVWGNGVEANSVQLSPDTATITYSCIQGGFDGEGNIDEDPMLLSDNNYCLQSVSPCIDSGCPDDAVAQEPLPNGSRVNMGAYGGTVIAAKTTIN